MVRFLRISCAVSFSNPFLPLSDLGRHKLASVCNAYVCQSLPLNQAGEEKKPGLHEASCYGEFAHKPLQKKGEQAYGKRP
jgi:hypothetical protein